MTTRPELTALVASSPLPGYLKALAMLRLSTASDVEIESAGALIAKIAAALESGDKEGAAAAMREYARAQGVPPAVVASLESMLNGASVHE